MRRVLPWLLLALMCAAALVVAMRATPTSAPAQLEQPVPTASSEPTVPVQPLPPPAQRTAPRSPAFLPPEAIRVIASIRQGGPFPHRQDGSVFGNREGLLPRQPRGWYREYTVDTPGLGHRGARRIVTGGTPPTQWYYTEDHYQTFRRFEPGGRQ